MNTPANVEQPVHTGTPTAAAPAGALVSTPAKLLRFIARITHLKPGRYTITLSIYGDRCDWSISEGSKIER